MGVARAAVKAAAAAVPAAAPRPAPAARPPAPKRSTGSSGSTASAVVDGGAGLVLGVLVWVWVVLPFLKGGPTQVKDVLRAKFLNRSADGEWLP